MVSYVRTYVLQNSYIPPNEPETVNEIKEEVEFVTKLIQNTAWESTPNPPDKQHVIPCIV